MNVALGLQLCNPISPYRVTPVTRTALSGRQSDNMDHLKIGHLFKRLPDVAQLPIWLREAKVSLHPRQLDGLDLVATVRKNSTDEVAKRGDVLETESVGAVEQGRGFGISEVM